MMMEMEMTMEVMLSLWSCQKQNMNPKGRQLSRRAQQLKSVYLHHWLGPQCSTVIRVN